MRCIVLPAADTDIIRIARYIAPDSMDAAERFLVNALDTISDIERFPRWNPLFDPDRFPGLYRKAIKGFDDYLMFYFIVNDETARVERVLHGARDLSEQLDPLFGR